MDPAVRIAEAGLGARTRYAVPPTATGARGTGRAMGRLSGANMRCNQEPKQGRAGGAEGAPGVAD